MLGDLYVILGLEAGAPEAAIKRAYRRLARRFHPDINPGDGVAEARFRQIAEAYEILLDPARRSRYDASGGAPASTVAPQSGFAGFDFSTRGQDHAVTFGDLFAEVLTSRGARADGPARGADLHQAVRLTFEEALTGVERSVTLTRREACRPCAGTGMLQSGSAACPLCEGSGSVRSSRGHMVFTRRCPGCAGTGQVRPRPCGTCGGSGELTRAETVAVRLPAGVSDGERVRIPGLGNAGRRGGEAGDLYLTASVAPHPVFRREGDDLHIVVPVAIHEAALGARLEVPSPEGTVRLRVPPGTQSGQQFRLRERGATSTRTGRRGDLIVEARLMLPALLDERSKELLREFGKINGGLHETR